LLKKLNNLPSKCLKTDEILKNITAFDIKQKAINFYQKYDMLNNSYIVKLK
jgi:hypothetical protein